MNRLKFNGMATYFKAMLETHALGNQTIDQTISALIQAEWEERENKYDGLQSMFYWNLQKLVSKLRIARADGSYSKNMERIEKTDLLILDDYALQPLDSVASMSLLEILEERYGRKSTIMASQLPIDMWYEMCKGGKVLSDAIFDRLINGSNKIEMDGESMRKK